MYDLATIQAQTQSNVVLFLFEITFCHLTIHGNITNSINFMSAETMSDRDRQKTY